MLCAFYAVASMYSEILTFLLNQKRSADWWSVHLLQNGIHFWKRRFDFTKKRNASSIVYSPFKSLTIIFPLWAKNRILIHCRMHPKYFTHFALMLLVKYTSYTLWWFQEFFPHGFYYFDFNLKLATFTYLILKRAYFCSFFSFDSCSYWT